MRNFIIAQKYSIADFAYYNRGLRFSQIVPENLSESLISVLFPVFSNYISNHAVLKTMRKSIQVTGYITFPLILGLFSIADNLVLVLLTEKWASSILYIKMFCVAYLLYPIEQIMEQSIKAEGRGEVLLTLNLFKRGIGIVFLLITFQHGVYAIGMGFVCSMIINYLLTAFFLNIYFAYQYKNQLYDIYKSLFISIIMTGSCLAMNWLQLSPFLTLFGQIVSGVVVYVCLSAFFKIESFEYLINILFEYGKQENGKGNCNV